MSQYVQETCNESSGNWLPITEYSVKSGMSLSTIRRKIKSNSIAYRLDKGKYFIFFNAKEFGDLPPHLTAKNEMSPASNKLISNERPATLQKSDSEKRETYNRLSAEEDAFRMVGDAYEHALREKDERIKLLEQKNRDLEDRLNELRLLVQVLEEKFEVHY